MKYIVKDQEYTEHPIFADFVIVDGFSISFWDNSNLMVDEPIFKGSFSGYISALPA